MREIRKTGRAFTRCQVVVKVLKAGSAVPSGPPQYGHTSDLSLNGVRLVLGAGLPVGAQVELVVVLQNPPATFRHIGLVRWCKSSAADQKYFIGTEFTATSPAVMQSWEKLLTGRSPLTMVKSQVAFAKDDQSVW